MACGHIQVFPIHSWDLENMGLAQCMSVTDSNPAQVFLIMVSSFLVVIEEEIYNQYIKNLLKLFEIIFQCVILKF